MARPAMFNTMAKKGIVTSPLDKYLTTLANKPNDRAINVNAPSCAGRCNRENYYSRMCTERDGGVDPRLLRIFNNGDGVHERLQNYLSDMGLLIMDEVPLINDDLKIQGHTDGFLDLEEEIAILEIKSINDRGFTSLKDAKEEHKMQGLVYIFCAEARRQYIQTMYPTLKAFRKSYKVREEYFRNHYQHMKGGKKYTRDEKIENEVKLNLIADDILWETKKPVEKVVFLYENKNTQELKEYVVTSTGKDSVETMQRIRADYNYINQCVELGDIPPRLGTSASSNECRWCNYKIQCWN